MQSSTIFRRGWKIAVDMSRLLGNRTPITSNNMSCWCSMVSIETEKPTEDTRILPLSSDTVYAEKFVGLGTDSRVVSTRARRPGLGVPIWVISTWARSAWLGTPMASVEKTGTERLNENKTKQKPTRKSEKRGRAGAPPPVLCSLKSPPPWRSLFLFFTYLQGGGRGRRGGGGWF